MPRQRKDNNPFSWTTARLQRVVVDKINKKKRKRESVNNFLKRGFNLL